MNAAEDYFGAGSRLLAELWEGEREGIERAAEWIAQTLVKDGLLFAAGSGHSHMLAEELFYRAGGLAAVVPLLETPLMLHDGAVKSTRLERVEGYAEVVIDDAAPTADDLLVIASNSGRNAYPVGLALAARKRGCRTIAVTSLDTARQVESRHSSGKLLAEVADLVLDNHVPYGDAALDIAGVPGRVAPLSTLAGVTLLNASIARAVQLAVGRGHVPDVFTSANSEGADQAPDLERWRRRVRRL